VLGRFKFNRLQDVCFGEFNEKINVVFKAILNYVSDISVTILVESLCKFVGSSNALVLEHLNIAAFTHKNLEVTEIGMLHIEEQEQKERLSSLKSAFGFSELMFLSTCNRVEFTFCTDQIVSQSLLTAVFETLYPNFTKTQIETFSSSAELTSGIQAVNHILNVASSIDSMVIGEREIITQVRSAFERCRSNGLTGDLIRLAMRYTIETAKKVYTETSIAKKPVSVVSLAYHRLRDMNISLDARILIIGAGMTNTNMSRFLKKHGFTKFVVFNRTLSKAEKLAHDLHGQALPLSALDSYSEGFDVIISCTGADSHIITPEIYHNLLAGDEGRKVVIDIALPQDLDPQIIESHNVTHISVNVLQKISNENLKERSKEIAHVESIITASLEEFKQIHRIREVEIAMREVPEKVKEIRSIAVNEIFKKDIDMLDENSKDVLEKVLGYMEKKYMSVPMIMAKEILINKD
jgi:glutamyl-tRNA reductase